MPTPTKKDFIVPCGTIVRQHGITRDGINTFKAQLHMVGGGLFETADVIQISKRPIEAGSPTYTDIQEYLQLKLVAPSSPLGARWQETPSVLLRVPTSQGDLIGREVGFARSQFPELSTGFYLCDLMGSRVANPDFSVSGRVLKFFDVGSSRVPATNVEVVTDRGFHFEFPISLLPAKVENIKDHWIVPDLELWAALPKVPAGAADHDRPKKKKEGA